MTTGAGLEVVDLVRHRGGRRIVDGLTLSVRPGEVVGLLGPNGAGKSTSFRLILGLEAMDAGAVSLDGQPLAGLSLWRRIRAGLGYLPQEPSVFRRLSVRGNIEVALEAVDASAASSVSDILRDSGLMDLSESRADTLSGGEQRRLEIARCLATNPRIVLFDEPFAGVDPLAISSLKARLRSLAEQGVGVLITDHAVHDTLAICDRAVIIDKGCVVAAGRPEEVSKVQEVRARYLGQDFRLHSSAP